MWKGLKKPEYCKHIIYDKRGGRATLIGLIYHLQGLHRYCKALALLAYNGQMMTDMCL